MRMKLSDFVKLVRPIIGRIAIESTH